MATREDNIKKINDELEQLSDDELDKVAGGLRHWIHTDDENITRINDEAKMNPNLIIR